MEKWKLLDLGVAEKENMKGVGIGQIQDTVVH